MYGRRDELSADVLERAAREALTQPQPGAMWDYRLYDTHGCVMSWADRGDDILAESNYLCVLEHLQGVAVQDDGDAQETPDEYVLDVSVSHWLVGSLRQLFIQVYDDAGEFTETFKEAVCVVIALREDYPVFDDSDFSEREWEAARRDEDDALTVAAVENQGAEEL